LDGALKDPFSKILMGVTAENLCDRHGLTREMQDALAVESHRRAAAAIQAGYFREQIVPHGQQQSFATLNRCAVTGLLYSAQTRH
jgi:acetyl-CoA C-acetyltransferase